MKLKYVSLFMVLLITFSMILPTSYAAQKTLDQLLAEATANRNAYNAAKNQKELTIQERDEAARQKASIEAQITELEKNLNDIEAQITKFQADIQKKDKQMKEIISFVQLTGGENNYLEYIFGATDFTDFIYRVSVSEQLSNYNNNLIKEYQDDVKKLDDKKNELASKQNELTKKEQELAVLEVQLNSIIEKISEGMLSQDEEYKTTIGLINNLKSLGCKGSETMSACQTRIANASKNNSSAGSANYNGTYMPITSGWVTSDYGHRSLDYHTGIDFSGGGVTTVYPVASGRVVYVRYGSTSMCGNHIVYVYHPDYGYTTSYWHLTNSYVKTGDYVSPNTAIGKTGGAGYTDGDSVNGTCAYGGHVHLNLFNGLTTTNRGRINPRNWLKNIPRQGVKFTSYR